MSAGYEMRVSDAERDAAAGELREHFASGRLTQEELDQRLTAVFAAKTRGDLNALFTDLPSSTPGWGGQYASSGPVSGSGQGWRYGGYGPGTDDGQSWNPRRRVGLLAGLIPVLVIFGALWAFGLGGGGRPIGIVLLIAAFALLRRLLLVIFGRRRGGRGPRGPRGARRRRRY